MNLIIDLSLNKRKEYIYDTIFIIINKYIKIIRYFLLSKRLILCNYQKKFIKKMYLNIIYLITS